jgi:hypothetical protein
MAPNPLVLRELNAGAKEPLAARGDLVICHCNLSRLPVNLPTRMSVASRIVNNPSPLGKVSMAVRTTVGLLYPGHAAEDDYQSIDELLGPTVALRVVHTSVGEDAHRVDALLDLGSSSRLLEGADQLRRFDVDALIWACTSGSFVFGWEGARHQVDVLTGALGVPASSTSFAFVHATRALGVARVAVAATYPEAVAARFAEFLGNGAWRLYGCPVAA